MKRLMVSCMGLMMLVGCGNKLNEFNYADIDEQSKLLLIETCSTSKSFGYCKVLSNGDIVYFSKSHESDIIVNSDSNEVLEERIYDNYEDFVDVGNGNPVYLENAVAQSLFIKEQMDEFGLDGNGIYVIQDMHGDLLLRVTNGKVDYNYFTTKEAQKIYKELSKSDTNK